jgi:hypothetical protein
MFFGTTADVRSWRKAVVGRFVYLRFCIGLIMCP